MAGEFFGKPRVIEPKVNHWSWLAGEFFESQVLLSLNFITGVAS